MSVAHHPNFEARTIQLINCTESGSSKDPYVEGLQNYKKGHQASKTLIGGHTYIRHQKALRRKRWGGRSESLVLERRTDERPDLIED